MEAQSVQQAEARATGEQKETVKYFAIQNLITLIVFSLAVISGVLWSQFIMKTIATYIWGVNL